MKFCGLESKTRHGQPYLWFAAVGKAQNLPAETSTSPTDSRPGILPATGLFSLVLESEIFDISLSACGKCGIQYTERGGIEYACNYTFFRLLSNTSCAISVR